VFPLAEFFFSALSSSQSHRAAVGYRTITGTSATGAWDTGAGQTGTGTGNGC
jgi:hypothetical protein